MLSAFKKLTILKDEHENMKSSDLQTMPRSLQSKFSKGVQYNMKIIIKGDRNVGKSSLFNRLQGRSFSQTYSPTEEIQVTSIQWNYKVTDDIVKVEVWDVVDKGKKRVLSRNLKLGNTKDIEVLKPALDAEFLNVYKGTNGVILMMDITKNWTFEYIQRELEKIPDTIPILVLGNHCDMDHHRTTTLDHVVCYLEILDRKFPVRYAESSMSNGFGLKFLYNWFNLPFLHLQRETLLVQLDTNKNEIDITTQELDLYQQTDDFNYKIYMEKLTNHRRYLADSSSNVPTFSVVMQTQHNFDASITPLEAKKKIKEASTAIKSVNHKIEPSMCVSSLENNEETLNFKERCISPQTKRAPKMNMVIHNIEEFVPDDSLDKSFLEEINVNTTDRVLQKDESDSDSEIVENPLVAGFQDYLDPEDVVSARKSSLSTLLNLDHLESGTTVELRGSPDGGDDLTKKNNDFSMSVKDGKIFEDMKKRSKRDTSSLYNCNEFEKFINSKYKAV